MAKHKDREFSQSLFDSVQRIAGAPAAAAAFFADGTLPAGELRKMKQFRFQLLHRWLVEHFAPCRAADIAGGKGLLAYLLQQSGWEAVVVDPVPQPLPDKYKDIGSDSRVRLPAAVSVPHIDAGFERQMARRFDLLIGLHAHGCNVAVIEAAAAYGCGFVLLPCCVIDEPFYPPAGVHWLESLAAYAVSQGHTVYPFRLNFKGQNIGLCAPGRCRLRGGAQNERAVAEMAPLYAHRNTDGV